MKRQHGKYTPQYLCFKAETAGVSVGCVISAVYTTPLYLEYSTDKTNWTVLTPTTTESYFITLQNVGSKVYIRGVNNTISYADKYFHFLGSNGYYSCYGDINTLLNYANNNTNSLVGKNYCYATLFYGNNSITQAPSLPAKILAEYCYANMFAGCLNLTQAPSLPAKILAEYCYANMFADCIYLTQAPALPATTLASYCYENMFAGCLNLTQAPVLPATTLASYCYEHMFNYCSCLSYIKVFATSWPTNPTYSDLWVEGVAASGTFVKPPNTSIPIGVTGIPTSWVSVDISDYEILGQRINNNFKLLGQKINNTYKILGIKR